MLCKIAIIFLVISHGAGNFVSRFEFEAAVGGPGTNWSPWRSGASKTGALHLRTGDRVVLKLCLTDSVTLAVDSLRYSNDGLSDQLDISIDNGYIGTVNTDETIGGWGEFWNNLKSARDIGHSVSLAAGDHALKIDVIAADYYGTEIDSLDVSTNIYVDPKHLWCGAELNVHETRTERPDAHRQLSTTAAAPTTTSPNSAVLPTASKSTSSARKTTPSSTTKAISSTPAPLTTERSKVTTPPKTSTSPTLPILTSNPPRLTTQGASLANLTTSSTTYPTTTSTKATYKTTTAHPTTSKTSSQSTTTTTTATTTATTTTTQTTTTTTTPTTTTLPPETTTAWIFHFVHQNSAPAHCVDTANVNITFTPLSIRNVEIVARAGTAVSHSTSDDTVTGPDLCDRSIWDLGNSKTSASLSSPFARPGERDPYTDNLVYPGDQMETLTPLTSSFGRTGRRDLGVNVSIANLQQGFPSVIFPKPAKHVNSKQTQSVNLKYSVKGKDYKRARKAYFTLGLHNVTEDTKIGVGWARFPRKRTSRVQYFTFTPDSTVMVWKIPPKAIKPKRKNTLRLVFDKKSADLVNIDFMRLDFAGSEYKFRQRVVAKLPKWNIRGWEYKKIKGIKNPMGMGLEINNGRMMYSFAKVVLLRRPLKKVLSIDRDGNIYPYHGLKISRKGNTDVDDPLFTDVSGIRIRPVGVEIKNLYINTLEGIITIAYEDGVFVQISFEHSKAAGTKLKILYTNLLVNDIYFFSTRYTDSLTAVNRLDVDGRDDFDILDPDITGVKGQWFTFRKTSRNPMFEASSDIQLFFPRENIQSQRKPGTEVEI